MNGTSTCVVLRHTNRFDFAVSHCRSLTLYTYKIGENSSHSFGYRNIHNWKWVHEYSPNILHFILKRNANTLIASDGHCIAHHTVQLLNFNDYFEFLSLEIMKMQLKSSSNWNKKFQLVILFFHLFVQWNPKLLIDHNKDSTKFQGTRKLYALAKKNNNNGKCVLRREN